LHAPDAVAPEGRGLLGLTAGCIIIENRPQSRNG
jgi:hypothetical protein